MAASRGKKKVVTACRRRSSLILAHSTIVQHQDQDGIKCPRGASRPRPDDINADRLSYVAGMIDGVSCVILRRTRRPDAGLTRC